METSQAVVAVPHPDPEHEDPSNDPSSSSEEGVADAGRRTTHQ